ncbi:sensor histidine kinase [Actinoplanes subtropicus]|uniref:sensor histidine kinase n=1 Tax=Actinoplanes subtropicus TaxID=543632 RepID=UPI00068CF493|nr:sensor histidine kinase [Actinoplanes subtropicus]
MTRKVLAGVAVALSVAVTLVWAFTGRGEFWPRWVYFGFLTVAAGVVVFGRALRVPPGRRRWLAVDAAFCGLLVAVDLTVYVLSGGGYFWPFWTTLAAGTLLGAHLVAYRRPPGRRERELIERVGALSRSRSGALDRQAAELKRVERDLHDGAQARMVSLALTLGLAGDLLRRDPGTAERLLDEARSTARAALDDLRAVMHSIQPPVLADRGLGDAVRALALDLALPVRVTGEPPPAAVGAAPGEPPPAAVGAAPGRPPGSPSEAETALGGPVAPLSAAAETAVYFAVAECLSNVVKHAGATSAEVTFDRPAPGTLRITVLDDGVGGADPATGSGLRGIAERLEAVDGTLTVDSPPGGPTLVTITVPVRRGPAPRRTSGKKLGS